MPDGRMSPPTTKDHPVYAIGERSVTAGLYATYDVAGTTAGAGGGGLTGTYTDTLARLATDGRGARGDSDARLGSLYGATHPSPSAARRRSTSWPLPRRTGAMGSVVIAPGGELRCKHIAG